MSVWTSKVGDVARKDVISVGPNATIADVARLMYASSSGSVVVVSPEGKVIGIFTEKDLSRVVSNRVSYDAMVGDYMTKNPVTVYADEPVTKAVETMSTHRVRHLPVVDRDGRLVGIVTARDIVDLTERYLAATGYSVE